MSERKKLSVFQKAIQYMEEHVAEKLKMVELADHCEISVSWLEKTFYACVGKGAMRYFLDLKLEHAATMLREGYSVNEIAKALNFSSAPHLSVSFKKKYGVSPLKYKHSY